MTKIPFFIGLVWSTASAFGCSCAPVSVKEAKEGVEVVFRGTITEIRDGNVHFRVTRVWKGDVGPTFDMPEILESAACFGFLPSWLQVGNDLLVFATRRSLDADDHDYFTNICGRTGRVMEVRDTLAKLGRGKPPRSPRQ